MLNTPGKTKDNIQSRLDQIGRCRRDDLDISRDQTMCMQIFRISNKRKGRFVLWLKRDINFLTDNPPNLVDVLMKVV